VTKKSWIITVSICFLTNIWLHRSWETGLINTIVVMIMAGSFLKKTVKTEIVPAIFLGLTPLLAYQPSSLWGSVGIVIETGLIILMIKTRGKLKVLIGTIMVLVTVYLLMMANRLLSWPFLLNREIWIINGSPFSESIQYLGRNKILFYQGYYFVGNLFNFLTLKNGNGALLLLNAGYLLIGVKKALENWKENWATIIVLALGMIVVGLSISQDSLGSVYPLTPILVYLIILGWKRIKEEFFYGLAVLSLIMIIGPKV